AAVTDPAAPQRLTAWVHGHVQGVGFRWWTRARALELGLAGSATNLADGRVEVVAEGPADALAALLALLRGPGTPGRVDTVIDRTSAARAGACTDSSNGDRSPVDLSAMHLKSLTLKGFKSFASATT